MGITWRSVYTFYPITWSHPLFFKKCQPLKSISLFSDDDRVGKPSFRFSHLFVSVFCLFFPLSLPLLMSSRTSPISSCSCRLWCDVSFFIYGWNDGKKGKKRINIKWNNAKTGGCNWITTDQNRTIQKEDEFRLMWGERGREGERIDPSFNRMDLHGVERIQHQDPSSFLLISLLCCLGKLEKTFLLKRENEKEVIIIGILSNGEKNKDTLRERWRGFFISSTHEDTFFGEKRMWISFLC